MKKVLFVVALVAAFVSMAMAADANKAATIAPFVSVHGLPPIMSSDWKVPPPTQPKYCKGATCLYYAGDFDGNNANANGICMINNTVSDCETWVGVKPNKDASVTGITYNSLVFQTVIGTKSTPFNVHTGMAAGKPGKVFCKSKGSVTLTPTGRSGFGFPEYSYTIKKLAAACALTAKTLYYVSMQPQYTDGASWGFLSDVTDTPAPNHHGWANVKDKGFANYPSGGLDYAPLSGSTGGCGGIGCDVMSIALTGTE